MIPPTDSVWTLRHPSSRVTKTWKQDGTIENYSDPKQFIGKEVPVADIRELSKLLASLEAKSNSCVIRGKYKGSKHAAKVEPDDFQKNRVLRRKSVHEDVAHNWIMVDIDSFKPAGFSPLLETVESIDEFIVLNLPKCFHGVSYHWQLSSSAGHPSKDPAILKVHVWFWLKTPYTCGQLRAWATATNYKADKSLLDTIQVHYTASPVFEEGVNNPIRHRSGFVDGDFGDAVALEIAVDELRDAGDGSAPASRHQKIERAQSSDPIADLLRKKKMVKSKRADGGLNIVCPRDEHHSGDSGESSTIHYPAHTGGHVNGSFVCLHEHCRNVPQSIFREALGYDDVGDVFGDSRAIQLRQASQINPEPIRWLRIGWLALGKLILLAGSPGTGKTTLAMDMAAVVSTGGTWPDGTACEVGDVVIWTGEDDPTDTLVPRLIAANADLKRVHFVGDAVDLSDSRAFDPSKDMPLLMAEIQNLGNVRLVIVDPIVSAVAGDSHKNAEVRRALQPLVDMAIKINAALVGITHFTKGTGGRDTTERVTGSLAFAALARIVLATARDVDAGDFLLTRSKSNIGPDGGGWRYKLEQVDLPNNPGIVASRVVWGDELEGNARELIADAEGDPKGKPAGVDSVESWLTSMIAQPMKATEVYEFGRTKGYSERKLQRVLQKIGGISEKLEFRGPAWWHRPGDAIPVGDGLESAGDHDEL